jgi:hypothetical protein
VRRAFGVILLITVASTAEAHHGKDFLLVESYEVPHPGSLYLVTSGVLAMQDENDVFEGEPSIPWGDSRLAFDCTRTSRRRGRLIRYRRSPRDPRN